MLTWHNKSAPGQIHLLEPGSCILLQASGFKAMPVLINDQSEKCIITDMSFRLFSLSPETPCQLEYRHFVCFFSAFFSMLLCIIGSLVNWAYEEMSPLSRSWICEPLQMVKSQILLLVLVTSHLQLHDPIISARSFTIILSLKPHQEFLT